MRPAQRDHPFPIVAAAGSTERDAAAALFVSRSRIRSHIKSICFKLGSSSRDEAIACAHELGLNTSQSVH